MLLAVGAGLLLINGPAASDSAPPPLHSLGQTHVWLACAMSLLTLSLAVSLFFTRPPALLRWLGWGIALPVNLALGLIGFESGASSVAARVLHTLLSYLFLSAIAAVAVLTAASGNPARTDTGSESPVPIRHASLVTWLATLCPVVLSLQVTLGVLFRQGVTEAAPHTLWGLFTAVYLTLALAIIVASEQPALQSAAVALALLAALQILLGFTVLTMKSLDIDPRFMIAGTIVHAVTRGPDPRRFG